MLNRYFWRLEDAKTGKPVTLPLRRVDFRGEDSWTVFDGTPPRKLGSQGHIFVKDEDDRTREFYPGVYGLAWRLRPELFTASQLMRARGGGFASCLAEAYQVADQDNAWRILEAFPDLFTRYLEEVENASGAEA